VSHERPWRKSYARTFGNNGSYPLYILDAGGRKICAIWGTLDGEREETADLIIKAVRTYDKAMLRKAAREAEAMLEMPGLKEALDVD